MSCRRFTITGKVQGVWFRASAREQAERLGLRGHAINLPDGRVEVLACGSDAKVDELAVWLRDGPPLANVVNVTDEPVDEQPPGGFSIG